MQIQAFRIILVLILLRAMPLRAQSERVEVFGQVGRMDAVADEGSLGGITPFGGGIGFQITERLVFEADFQTAQIKRTREAETITWRRSQFSPALSYRWSIQRRCSVFVGGGLGLHRERIRRDNRITARIDRVASHVRGGVLINVTDNLFLRPEAGFWIAYGPRITAGIRVAFGYRF